MIKFTIITLFQEALKPYLESSMMYKAAHKGLVEFNYVDLREFGLGPHKSVDDTPYGGGDGMLLRCEPVFNAIESVKKKDSKAKVILPTPVGDIWNQDMARKFANGQAESFSRSIFSDVENTERPSPLGEGARERSEKGLFSRLVAIGEVGLDYHYDGYNREAQIKLFEQMLQLAVDNDLPVSFHIREAFADFFPIIENFPKVRGVVHSFTDSKKVLKRILNETEFYVGVNGLATYSTLPTPPLERILLETDAPFLAPIPHRGSTNEPAYIADIAKWLAEKLDMSQEEVAAITSENVENLYKLSNHNYKH